MCTSGSVDALRGRIQVCANPSGHYLGCAAECVYVLVDVDTHRSWLTHSWCTRVAFTAAARPPRPRGHALTPWQTPCPSPPRARHQASQEATGNSDPPGLHKHGLETAPTEPVAGWRSTVANGVVGSPPYPAWLCPPDVSALKFPAEFSILWRNRGIGRGGRCSEPKTQCLAGPPAPAGHFFSCWKEPLCPVRVTSPVPSSRAFPPSLWITGPSPCPSSDYSTEYPHSH